MSQAMRVEFEGVSFELPKAAISAYAVRDGALILQLSAFSGELVIAKAGCSPGAAAAPLKAPQTPTPAPRKRKVQAGKAAAAPVVSAENGAAYADVPDDTAAPAAVVAAAAPRNKAPAMSAPSPRLKRAKPTTMAATSGGNGGVSCSAGKSAAAVARQVTFAADLALATVPGAHTASKPGNDDGMLEKWQLLTLAPNTKTAGGARGDASAATAAAPPGRWGSTMFMHGRKLIVYGGEDDSDDGHTLPRVAAFDLDSRTWQESDGEGVGVGAAGRCWHTATYVPRTSSAIVFGGQAGDGGSDKAQGGGLADEVMILDCDMMFWYAARTTGTRPVGRIGHAAALLQPPAATTGGDRLVVFGGFRGRSFLNDVAVLDLRQWRWKLARTVGPAPSARAYHSATAIDEHRVVFFGGLDNGRCYNDIHVLDTSGDSGGAWKWKVMHAGGAQPRPRSGHSAALIPGTNRLLVWGGWDIITFADAAAAAAAAAAASSGGARGGNNHDGELAGHATAYDDAWELDLSTWCWTRHTVRASAAATAEGVPVGRVGHAAVAVASPSQPGTAVLYAFGGQARDERHADVRVMRVC